MSDNVKALAWEVEVKLRRRIKELEAALASRDAEPVAWRTFDGEGNYDYRTYESNEYYADDWSKRNPHHVGWVEPLYIAPPNLSAAVAAAIEKAARVCEEQVSFSDATDHDEDVRYQTMLILAAAIRALQNDDGLAALREFGRKVAHKVDKNHETWTVQERLNAIVEEVLKGE